jgi:hypothetical protein
MVMELWRSTILVAAKADAAGRAVSAALAAFFGEESHVLAIAREIAERTSTTARPGTIAPINGVGTRMGDPATRISGRCLER